MWNPQLKEQRYNWLVSDSIVAATEKALVFKQSERKGNDVALLQVTEFEKPPTPLGKTSGEVALIKGSPTGTFVASLGLKGEVRIWDTNKPSEVELPGDWRNGTGPLT